MYMIANKKSIDKDLSSHKKPEKPIIIGANTVLILDNIRSVHNVGSIFRTVETIGIFKIYCIGTTPTPLDRFGNKRKDFAKVALGAEDILLWKYVEQRDAIKLVKQLKSNGTTVVSLEQDKNSIDYKDFVEVLEAAPPPPRSHLHLSEGYPLRVTLEQGHPPNLAIIVGNEVDGVSKDLLKLSDYIAEIPMRGKKESLNVAVATGIFLYRVLDS